MPATALPAKPKPKVTYPRPELVHDHRTLFKEPAYTDGEPYALEDDGDDDE